MAAATLDLDSATRALQSLNEHSRKLTDASSGAREAAIASARLLIRALETPSEYIMRTVWAETGNIAALQTALDLGLIKMLASDTSARGLTVDDMASPSSADSGLVSRIMKHLSAMLVVDEIAADTYAANNLTTGLADPKIGDGVLALNGSAGPPLLQMPAFLAASSYKNPVGLGDKGPFQIAHNTTLPVYNWLREHPNVGAAFASYMSGKSQSTPFWAQADFCPPSKYLAHPELNNQTPLVVDVGGGMAQDLQLICNASQDLPGRLINEDVGPVLDQVKQSGNKLDPRIELISYDFFTPQPDTARGARAYHMHHILHNWDDAESLKILANVRAAMKPGFSKLLVFENVVPNVGADWKMTGLDWVMMANCATVERTEKQWRELLRQAGFTITTIHTRDASTESLIEAVMDGGSTG